MCMVFVVTVSVSILCLALQTAQLHETILACGTAVALSFCIIYNLQPLLLDRKLNISPNDYGFAAMKLNHKVMHVLIKLLLFLIPMKRIACWLYA